jgi:hypothetical protein
LTTRERTASLECFSGVRAITPTKAHTRVGRVYIIMTRADLSFSVKLYSIVGIIVFLFWLLNRI